MALGPRAVVCQPRAWTPLCKATGCPGEWSRRREGLLEGGAQAPQRDTVLPAPALPSGGTQEGPSCVAGVESSLRVTRCRQILRGLPEHNYAVLGYLMGFLHEVGERMNRAGGALPSASAPTLPRARGHPSSALEGHPLAPEDLTPGPAGSKPTEQPSVRPAGVTVPTPATPAPLPSVIAHDLHWSHLIS